MNRFIITFLALNVVYYSYLLNKVDDSSKMLTRNIEQLANIIEQSHKNGCLIGIKDNKTNCAEKAQDHKKDIMEIINNE